MGLIHIYQFFATFYLLKEAKGELGEEGSVILLLRSQVQRWSFLNNKDTNGGKQFKYCVVQIRDMDIKILAKLTFAKINVEGGAVAAQPAEKVGLLAPHKKWHGRNCFAPRKLPRQEQQPPDQTARVAGWTQPWISSRWSCGRDVTGTTPNPGRNWLVAWQEGSRVSFTHNPTTSPDEPTNTPWAWT
ncbi:hypothetical protein Fcan01_28368 [Folsomia candida]|uniref:Uncharacterized protein n=1 Tax=Folsomia candida TaxID=158441 RepID=A0A226CV45_FOLCA|nr:hypothetical protein Fcan01_28368 [Folsomia candida]